VENYRKISSPEGRAGRAKELVRLYLADNAIEPVNIDGRKHKPLQFKQRVQTFVMHREASNRRISPSEWRGGPTRF